jgi:hypothetical protein
MLLGNGYYIVETKEEFMSRWDSSCNRFNYNAMPYDFDIELASFPLALRFQDSFDPHFCDNYIIVPMAEAYDNILKAYEEEITRLTASREKLKNLMKKG